MKALLAVLLLIGCGAGHTPSARIRNDRVVWDHEPTVGTDESALRQDVRRSLEAWRWGTEVASCEGADICVTLRDRGALQSLHGRAVWEPYTGTSCEARIFVQRWATVAHEIGHCYGLAHSDDRRSVMYATVRHAGDPLRSVTVDDLRALASIRP